MSVQPKFLDIVNISVGGYILGWMQKSKILRKSQLRVFVEEGLKVLPHDHAFSISIPDYACCYLFINRPEYLLDTPHIVSDSFLTGAYKF